MIPTQDEIKIEGVPLGELIKSVSDKKEREYTYVITPNANKIFEDALKEIFQHPKINNNETN